MNEIKLNSISQNGQRVLTTAQLAEAYGTDIKVISKNFNRNSSHYIEGVHFYRLTGDDLKEFKACRQIDDNLKFAPFIILWTERGALLHAKSLNTDKAWEVYVFLVENYFHTRQMMASYNNISMQTVENQLKVLENKISVLERVHIKIASKIIARETTEE